MHVRCSYSTNECSQSALLPIRHYIVLCVRATYFYFLFFFVCSKYEFTHFSLQSMVPPLVKCSSQRDYPFSAYRVACVVPIGAITGIILVCVHCFVFLIFIRVLLTGCCSMFVCRFFFVVVHIFALFLRVFFFSVFVDAFSRRSSTLFANTSNTRWRKKRKHTQNVMKCCS